jgi:hypothetical protein
MRCVSDAERALAAVQPKGPLEGNTTFRLKGHKDAKAVYLAGDFNHWDPTGQPMVKDRDGWIVRIDLTPGKYDYKFVVDGDWILDPDNPLTEKDREYTNSVRNVVR